MCACPRELDRARLSVPVPRVGRCCRSACPSAARSSSTRAASCGVCRRRCSPRRCRRCAQWTSSSTPSSRRCVAARSASGRC
eukprot:353875-Chlamydomonas_euryale.AAC.3